MMAIACNPRRENSRVIDMDVTERPLKHTPRVARLKIFSTEVLRRHVFNVFVGANSS